MLHKRILLLLFTLVFLYTHHLHFHPIPNTNQSPISSNTNQTARFPHIGKLKHYQLSNTSSSIFSPLSYLSFNKKIDTFILTFYNTHLFELHFVDVQYQSYLEVRVFTEETLLDTFKARIGFTLPDNFYPGGRITQTPIQEQSANQQGLNIHINRPGLLLNVHQHSIFNLSDSSHDGYIYGETNNNTTPQSINIRDDITVTSITLNYESAELSINANLIHILRHNLCLSYNSHNTLYHTCHGGYGNGHVVIDHIIKHKSLPTYNKRSKNVYNLDNNRTRTLYYGIRSTRHLSISLQQQSTSIWQRLPHTNWQWHYFKAYMLCFSKPQYYIKGDNIQKQRFIGLHLGKQLSHTISNSSIMQDYLFLNGNIYPLNTLNYTLNMFQSIGNNFTFQTNVNEQSLTFSITFTILYQQHRSSRQLIHIEDTLRLYGFWSGWVDKRNNKENKETNVTFYKIVGMIQTVYSIF